MSSNVQYLFISNRRNIDNISDDSIYCFLSVLKIALKSLRLYRLKIKRSILQNLQLSIAVYF